jgi:hypothetical protein
MQNDRMVLMPFSPEEFQNLIREVIKEELAIASSQKNEKLLNAKQLCDFLGIHISTLNSWKAQGKIPFKRLGKRILKKMVLMK